MNIAIPFLILFTTLVLSYFLDSIENAGNPGTLIQLTSSSFTNPYGYGVRPVRQRGMYFGSPSWTR